MTTIEGRGRSLFLHLNRGPFRSQPASLQQSEWMRRLARGSRRTQVWSSCFYLVPEALIRSGIGADQSRVLSARIFLFLVLMELGDHGVIPVVATSDGYGWINQTAAA